MKISTTCIKIGTFAILWALAPETHTLAQTSQNDSLKNARTQTINGTVTYDGTGAGTAGTEGTYIGYNAGSVTTGQWNTFVGSKSGNANTTGDRNIFIGGSSGLKNTTGRFNTFTGYASGLLNTTGESNVFMGLSAGNDNKTGSNNTYLGTAAANSNTGSNNVAVGSYSGSANVTGTGNVFLGNRSGYKELGSNKLYIANDSTSSPLIYGDFADKKLVFNGKAGIGTSTFPTTVGAADVSTYKLFVKGGILAEQVRIRTGWADYVFQSGYKLKSLAEVERYIGENGHLPHVPSATEVETSGLDLGEIVRIQQEKIEELTLYIIEQNKKVIRQEKDIDDIKTMLNGLKK